MRHRTLRVATFTFIAGLMLAMKSWPARAQTAPEVKPEAAATATAVEEPEALPSCGDCHADQATAFTTNAHGHGKAAKGEAIPNAVCESCHGNGKAHIEGGGDKALIAIPRGVAGANTFCLSCHDKLTSHISRQTGVHSNSTSVNCLTCHAIHKATPGVAHLLVKPELALCASCHGTQSASFHNKPYAHRIGRGGMECSSCHEPHGRVARESLAQSVTGEMPCLKCHFEKRGPYVFQHVAGVAGDCLTCHEAHGASNPKMLKRATVAQLCTECHSPIAMGALGSQPPSFHNLSLPRYQNCTTCHVAVHGSNRDPHLLR